jgi:hypothetical protein
MEQANVRGRKRKKTRTGEQASSTVVVEEELTPVGTTDLGGEGEIAKRDN